MGIYISSGMQYLIIFTIFSIMNAKSGKGSALKFIGLASFVFFSFECEYKINPYWDEILVSVFPFLGA